MKFTGYKDNFIALIEKNRALIGSSAILIRFFQR